jgi:DNA helicase-2/ATP-dependent DNA helicase PcrA
MRLKSQAVLFRTAHHSGPLEIELVRRNIPFVKFGGLKFLEAAHVKDLLAVMRWAENPRDRVVGFRALQLLPGLGPKTAAKAFDRVATSGVPFAPLSIYMPPSAAVSHWPAFVDLLDGLNERRMAWPDEISAVRDWLLPHLEARYEDAAIRSGDLEQLVRIAAQYPSRERFLTELTLDPPESTSDEAGAPLLDEDYLILSTIHSAKGQEWTAVSVLNVVDGCIPSDMATGRSEDIEEERRLLYVAMTRAKEQLDLYVPHRFYVTQQPKSGDRHMLAQRTRFITASVASHFETCTWPRHHGIASLQATTPSAPSVDLKARLGGAWKARSSG